MNGVARYTDEYLDHWAECFIEEQISVRLSLTLEQFLVRPTHYITRLSAGPQFAAEREIEHLPRQEGALIEKMKHHRFPRSISDFTVRKRTEPRRRAWWGK